MLNYQRVLPKNFQKTQVFYYLPWVLPSKSSHVMFIKSHLAIVLAYSLVMKIGMLRLFSPWGYMVNLVNLVVNLLVDLLVNSFVHCAKPAQPASFDPFHPISMSSLECWDARKGQRESRSDTSGPRQRWFQTAMRKKQHVLVVPFVKNYQQHGCGKYCHVLCR